MDEVTKMPETEGLQFGNLQFDRAEPVDSAAADAFACAFCAAPLRSSYYEINGRAACEDCRYRVEQEQGGGPGSRGFLRAVLAGCAAAAVGSGLYYAVRAIIGYDLSLVAIVVGFLVGGAVRWGTRGKGGRAYQILAVFLTYMAIAFTFLPPVLENVRDHAKDKEGAAAKAANPQAPLPVSDALMGLGALTLVIAAVPVLVGFKSPILLLIIGFGLWQAWKMNRRAVLSIAGPLQIRQPAAVG
jgi:hypothetical protein